MGAVVLQHLLVLGDGQTSEEHANLKIFMKTPGDALYCTFSKFKRNGNCTKALTTYAPSAGAFATPTSTFSCTSWYQKAMQADRWTFRRFRDTRSKRKPPYLDCRQELAEPLVLLADLESQLPCVAHNQHRDLERKINMIDFIIFFSTGVQL